MRYPVPTDRPDTELMLRALEQNCPRTTPKEVREALIIAANALQDWKTLAGDAARQLEEAATVRISQMSTISQADEVQRGVKGTMLSLAKAFRELA